ncbi:hypothetical protein B0H14DRAFT_3743472 [Mycena olivaceomarginata]|nr:hypothetical protein B0H14DRAFT_3743472 [Mycena olivaceomarginata]
MGSQPPNDCGIRGRNAAFRLSQLYNWAPKLDLEELANEASNLPTNTPARSGSANSATPGHQLGSTRLEPARVVTASRDLRQGSHVHGGGARARLRVAFGREGDSQEAVYRRLRDEEVREQERWEGTTSKMGREETREEDFAATSAALEELKDIGIIERLAVKEGDENGGSQRRWDTRWYLGDRLDIELAKDRRDLQCRGPGRPFKAAEYLGGNLPNSLRKTRARSRMKAERRDAVYGVKETTELGYSWNKEAVRWISFKGTAKPVKAALRRVKMRTKK